MKRARTKTVSVKDPIWTPSGMAWPLLERELVQRWKMHAADARRVCTLLEMVHPQMRRFVQEIEAGYGANADNLFRAAFTLAISAGEPMAAVGKLLGDVQVEDVFDVGVIDENAARRAVSVSKQKAGEHVKASERHGKLRRRSAGR